MTWSKEESGKVNTSKMISKMVDADEAKESFAMKLVAEVMTSGIPQTGATFHLPESMVIELIRKAQEIERKNNDALTKVLRYEIEALEQKLREERSRGEK